MYKKKGKNYYGLGFFPNFALQEILFLHTRKSAYKIKKCREYEDKGIIL